MLLAGLLMALASRHRCPFVSCLSDLTNVKVSSKSG
jgi:hypothetical protein